MCVCTCTQGRNSSPLIFCAHLLHLLSCFSRGKTALGYSTCIPKANLYNNQCVMQPPTHSQQSSLLPDHFFNGSHHIVWWSLALLKGRSRNLWLHSQAWYCLRQLLFLLPANSPQSWPPAISPCQSLSEAQSLPKTLQKAQPKTSPALAVVCYPLL